MYFIQITEPIISIGERTSDTYFAFPKGGGVREGDYYKKLIAQGTNSMQAEKIVIKEKIQFTSKTESAAYINPTKNICHGLLSAFFGFISISNILLSRFQVI